MSGTRATSVENSKKIGQISKENIKAVGLFVRRETLKRNGQRHLLFAW